MRLGVSYNVWDGEELLEASIKSIRENVDYISVVYQLISNFGNPCNEGLVPLLEKLVKDGLVDELSHYDPNSEHSVRNERKKRNIGVDMSRKNLCTHHMSMDTDEFYLVDDLREAKKVIEEGDYDSSACHLITYYKDSEHKLHPNETWYVSLIYKITENQKYEYVNKFPLSVDPTRQMIPGKIKVFTRQELEMHHMSHVRKDIKKKYMNSSARENFGGEGKIDSWVYYYENFVCTPTSKFPGNHEYKIIKTEKLFNIGNLT